MMARKPETAGGARFGGAAGRAAALLAAGALALAACGTGADTDEYTNC